MSVAERTNTYGIHHWRILRSSYGKLTRVRFELMITEFLPDALKHTKFEPKFLENIENIYHPKCDLFCDLFWDIARHTKFKSMATKGNEIPTLENVNNKVTLGKIQKVVKYLKKKEAPGLDDITNEMLKCSKVTIQWNWRAFQ